MGFVCCVPSVLMVRSIIAYTDAEEEASGVPSDEITQKQAKLMREGELCCVCMEARKDAACLPCGHKCMCLNCGTQLVMLGGRSCPICRTPISSIQQIFD